MATATDKAIIEQLKASGQYREFLVEFTAQKTQAREEFINKTFDVASLGTEMNGLGVALTYQAYKSVPASLSNAWTKSVADECLKIIQGTKALAGNWHGIYYIVNGVEAPVYKKVEAE